jgi:hypothetical protein
VTQAWATRPDLAQQLRVRVGVDVILRAAASYSDLSGEIVQVVRADDIPMTNALTEQRNSDHTVRRDHVV